jgi:hypothetical protein
LGAASTRTETNITLSDIQSRNPTTRKKTSVGSSSNGRYLFPRVSHGSRERRVAAHATCASVVL